MGLRARKSQLILALRGQVVAKKLTQEQAATFEAMYRRCRDEREQDEVTKALHEILDGWKTGTDAHSRLLRNADDFGDTTLDEDDDPPSLKAALARSQITFLK